LRQAGFQLLSKDLNMRLQKGGVVIAGNVVQAHPTEGDLIPAGTRIAIERVYAYPPSGSM